MTVSRLISECRDGFNYGITMSSGVLWSAIQVSSQCCVVEEISSCDNDSNLLIKSSEQNWCDH